MQWPLSGSLLLAECVLHNRSKRSTAPVTELVGTCTCSILQVTEAQRTMRLLEIDH